MGCHCNSPFTDHITGAPESVLVRALLAPSTDYVWVITDRHGGIYTLPFTTGENGFGTIEASDLPAGFFAPHGGPVRIQVKTDLDSCDFVKLPFVVQHDAAVITMAAGQVVKNYIGCLADIPTTGGGLSAQTTRVTINSGNAGATYTIAGAVSELAVLRNGVEDLDHSFLAGTWTFADPLVAGDKLTFIYNRS